MQRIQRFKLTNLKKVSWTLWKKITWNKVIHISHWCTKHFGTETEEVCVWTSDRFLYLFSASTVESSFLFTSNTALSYTQFRTRYLPFTLECLIWSSDSEHFLTNTFKTEVLQNIIATFIFNKGSNISGNHI